jgi:hypothetical protein
MNQKRKAKKQTRKTRERQEGRKEDVRKRETGSDETCVLNIVTLLSQFTALG